MIFSGIDDQARSGWDDVLDWFSSASRPALSVAIILIVSTVLFLIGRAAINGLTRRIEEGLKRGEKSAKRLLRRAKLPTAQESLQDQLETERRGQRARTVGVVLRSALGATISLVAFVMILAQIGVDIAPLLAAAGIVGIALGFGAQSLVKDLLAGVFMLLEDQYGVGDVIDLGDAVGSVEEVGLRSTRLRSLDGTVRYVPNGEITRVGNKSRLWSRAMIEIRVDYRENVEAARSALLTAAKDAVKEGNISPFVLDEPQVPGVESLAADAIVLRVLVQVQPGQQWAVQRAIRWHIRRQFTERGIRLAAPDNRMYTDYDDNPTPEKSVGAEMKKTRSASKPKKPADS